MSKRNTVTISGELEKKISLLQESFIRIDAVLEALQRDKSPSEGLSTAGEILLEAGREAVCVGLQAIEDITETVGIEDNREDRQKAYACALAADRSIVTRVAVEP